MQPLRKYKLSICCSTSEAIACLDFERSKSKFYGTFSDLFKIAMYYNIYRYEAGGVVSVFPNENMGCYICFIK